MCTGSARPPFLNCDRNRRRHHRQQCGRPHPCRCTEDGYPHDECRERSEEEPAVAEEQRRHQELNGHDERGNTQTPNDGVLGNVDRPSQNRRFRLRIKSYIGRVRAVVQRAGRASVTVDGVNVGMIDRGLLVLVCVAEGDGLDDAIAMAGKLARLRIFPDDLGRMNRSVFDVGGKVLVVSQFTLCADVGKGNRPSFTRAADRDHAESILEAMVEVLEAEGLGVATGTFGERMLVSLDNEGPVTVVIDVEGGRVV